jgi:hypothetical protein
MSPMIELLNARLKAVKTANVMALPLALQQLAETVAAMVRDHHNRIAALERRGGIIDDVTM